MKLRPLLISLALLTVAAPAQGMNWSLGANLGVVVIDPVEERLESVTLVGWPSQDFLNALAAPGLRIGFRGDDPRHQFFVDNGLFFFTTQGSGFAAFQVVGNYQYVFSGKATSPFVAGGAGLVGISGDSFISSDTSLSPIVGAGVGIQHRFAHGGGTVRAEIRVDRVMESEDEFFPVIRETMNYGLKLGFDLWMRSQP